MHEAGQLLAQRRIALGGAVLHCASGLLLECGQGRGANAIDIDQRHIREATGEADDAGLAEQLEQLADGGGFDLVESVGEADG